MREPVNVRLAVGADAPLVSTIHLLSRASAYRGLLPDRYLDSVMPAESAAFWPGRMARLEAGAGVAYLAERDAAPIGFICLERPDQHGSVCVDNLCAFPEHTGCSADSYLEIVYPVCSSWKRSSDKPQVLVIFPSLLNVRRKTRSTSKGSLETESV